MKNFFQEYFNFSKSERTATLLLLVLLLLSIGILLFVKNSKPNHGMDQAVLEQELSKLDSLQNEEDLSGENQFESETSSENTDVYTSNYSSQKNTSTYKENTYKTKQKNYDKYSDKKKEYHSTKKEIKKIDLNLADSITMINAGFKPWVIKKILKYKSILGGYHSTTQLLEVYGMKQKSYEWIVKRVYISNNPSLRKINLQSASFKEVLKHPYLNYEQVKGIFKLKDKGELSDSSVRDLLGKDLYTKLVPYLIF